MKKWQTEVHRQDIYIKLDTLLNIHWLKYCFWAAFGLFLPCKGLLFLLCRFFSHHSFFCIFTILTFLSLSILNWSFCFQILVKHIKAVLPGLKARISAQLVTVAKEHAAYGEITESKVCSLNKMFIYTIYIICIKQLKCMHKSLTW